MSDQRINLAELRERALGPSYAPRVQVTVKTDTALALVEAVEAAHALYNSAGGTGTVEGVSRPESVRGGATPAAIRLADALARFDFGERP